MRTFSSKKEIQAAIKTAITTNPKKAIDALMRVFEYQTADEQENGTVSKLNGVGFAGTDAEILTSFVNQYNRKGHLSEKQMTMLYSKIGKYAGQLTRQAIEKGMYVKEGSVWKVNTEYTSTLKE